MRSPAVLATAFTIYRGLAVVLAAGPAMATLIGGSVLAADMPLKAAPASVDSWSGIYFGGSGGVGRLRTDWDFLQGRDPTPNPTDDTNWVGGGLVGIQWQTGNWVFGAEANWIATGLETSATCPNPDFHCLARLNDYWTAGARVGYVIGNGLWYATGGYAQGRTKTFVRQVATGLNFEPTSVTDPGWFIGGGAEFMLSSSGLILGVEYDHVQFDTKTHHPFVPADVRNVRPDVDTVRARLSYKFEWWR